LPSPSFRSLYKAPKSNKDTIKDVLEMLSGHNRVEAAKLAGLSEVPAIVFENISDADAMVYVVETNLI